jgi:hypothetical protein
MTGRLTLGNWSIVAATPTRSTGKEEFHQRPETSKGFITAGASFPSRTLKITKEHMKLPDRANRALGGDADNLERNMASQP